MMMMIMIMIMIRAAGLEIYAIAKWALTTRQVESSQLCGHNFIGVPRHVTEFTIVSINHTVSYRNMTDYRVS
jgi:hypothetical protein